MVIGWVAYGNAVSPPPYFAHARPNERKRKRRNRVHDRGVQGQRRPSGRRTDPRLARQDAPPPRPPVRQHLGRALRGSPPGGPLGPAQSHQRLQRRFGRPIQLLRLRHDRRRTQTPKGELPATGVLMVTMHENPDYLLEAVKAGVAGYVLKDAGGERLVEAVRSTL